jgi:flagellar motor switch protein FliM
LMPSQEQVIALRAELRMRNRMGLLSICLPCHVLQTLTDNRATADDCAAELQSNLRTAKVHLTATLGAALTLRELMNLEPGDCITTAIPQNHPIDIEIAGRRKFAARLGIFRGHKAAQLTAREAHP